MDEIHISAFVDQQKWYHVKCVFQNIENHPVKLHEIKSMKSWDLAKLIGIFDDTLHTLSLKSEPFSTRNMKPKCIVCIERRQSRNAL